MEQTAEGRGIHVTTRVKESRPLVRALHGRRWSARTDRRTDAPPRLGAQDLQAAQASQAGWAVTMVPHGGSCSSWARRWALCLPHGARHMHTVPPTGRHAPTTALTQSAQWRPSLQGRNQPRVVWLLEAAARAWARTSWFASGRSCGVNCSSKSKVSCRQIDPRARPHTAAHLRERGSTAAPNAPVGLGPCCIGGGGAIRSCCAAGRPVPELRRRFVRHRQRRLHRGAWIIQALQAAGE